ncbi:MAG: peptidoglycan-binding domain-containing protein [Nocardioides sp.]
MGPTYGDRLLAAIHAWQTDHGLPVSDVWSLKGWRTVLADGPRGLVKIGSAGLGVRRLQRTLNATGRVQLRTNGVFDAATVAAVRQWQSSAKQEVTGVLTSAQWKVLQTGRK